LADRILLVGMMGAGKSSAGRAIASRLGWPAVDTDELVQQRTGNSIAQIFAERGENGFRDEEADALAAALAADGPLVVSVGGGAVLRAGNRRLLSAGGLVVWLRAEVATLARRLGGAESRPLLAGGPLEALPRLDAKRRSLYQEVAEVTVDVDRLTVGEVADRVVAAFQRPSSCMR
jgi:shikimate kinase